MEISEKPLAIAILVLGYPYFLKILFIKVIEKRNEFKSNIDVS